MPDKPRTYVHGEDLPPVESIPPHVTPSQFGRRLHNMLVAKNWRQADLARKAGIERNNISRYVRGLQLPSPITLRAIAQALGIKPEELYSEYLEDAIGLEEPMFEMKVVPSAPNMTWLRINRAVSTTTALKIAAMLNDDSDGEIKSK